MIKYNPAYLNLNERLSQIWLNKYTILFILAAFKLLFFSTSLRNALDVSKSYILSNCGTIDTMYSKTLNSTPHYIGVFGNYLINKALIQTVKTSLSTVSLLVYASEEILEFMVDFYLGTYECLLVAAIDGTVDTAVNATEKLIGFVNGSVGSIANDLDDGLNDLSKIINKAISAAEKVGSLFSDDDDDDDDDSSSSSKNIASVNLTIKALRNLYIPSSINDKLEKISDSTPTFDEVKNSTKNLIGIPFEKIRKEIKSINTTNIVGDPDVLYVPPINDNSNYQGICSANKNHITSFFYSMDHLLKVATIVCIVLLLIGAVVVLFPEFLEEFKLWKRLTQLREFYWYNKDLYPSSSELETINQEVKDPFNDKKNIIPDQFDVIAGYQTCFNPWHTRIVNFIEKIITYFNRSSFQNESNKRRRQWIVAYVASERALFILGIGMLAFFVSILQLIIITLLKRTFDNNSNMININSIANSSAVHSLKDDVSTWSNQVNLYIKQTEGNLNHQVFGWIEDSTESLNNTVTHMINGIDDTLADIFNGTLLYNPMKTVVSCVIENKLYTIEKSLTWIHNKANVTLPRINGDDINNLLSSSNNSTNATGSNNLATELFEDVIDDSKKIINKVIQTYHKSIIYEMIISLVFIGIWSSQIPIALVIARFKNF
ncbi:hypothetical protein Kpol_388p9 [Vanderwaltozyma polyspora DSM 70294]|uniref:Plasma membrane fusion protein PRM1 n=1 Tax=Vanderwaltozyma polyspora (strain ATCC 22028 / DSM 70294 / BCRC 21397 / CBS 2163 / NBRC 10782 / NRRL Y-8283 / UCD 57-17) TaxID=436907 RepID=PRM1_VANPO|nr:uncharacterized protein Kpol_388p9 [Vanderwaltozyma polyspora DSM 70294]A7TRZ7.1 RecName: Full=Plasma membrane fusion protein PRM1 [Vanderwaltozyma polyspora DSM 70294]EDO14965.1 hypothetical protein Kpol_388p9 [Vanderwaltozyma polyspora DSM 70294]